MSYPKWINRWVNDKNDEIFFKRNARISPMTQAILDRLNLRVFGEI